MKQVKLEVDWFEYEHYYINQEDLDNLPEELAEEYGKVSKYCSDAFEKYQEGRKKILNVTEQINKRICLYNAIQEAKSRSEKEKVIKAFGWKYVDTSLYTDGERVVKLHEAFEECKNNFSWKL